LKFAFPDEEQVTSKIDIGQSQPDYFAYSQSQAVKQRKDGLINQASISCPGPFWETACYGEQLFCSVEIEQIWNTGCRFRTRRGSNRVPFYPLLHDGEFEETMNGSKKMVVAARTHAAWVGSQKIVDH
jgi:hypothetical protein